MMVVYLDGEVHSPRDAIHDEEEEAEVVFVDTELYNVIVEEGSEVDEGLSDTRVRGEVVALDEGNPFVHGHHHRSCDAYDCSYYFGKPFASSHIYFFQSAPNIVTTTD